MTNSDPEMPGPDDRDVELRRLRTWESRIIIILICIVLAFVLLLGCVKFLLNQFQLTSG